MVPFTLLLGWVSAAAQSKGRTALENKSIAAEASGPTRVQVTRSLLARGSPGVLQSACLWCLAALECP